MIGRAACRGAATIVNAIPTGRGAAYGITLEADAEVVLDKESSGFRLVGPSEGATLVEGCVTGVLRRTALDGAMADVRVISNIPISRGLKSSSAVSNAVVMATAKAAAADLRDEEMIRIGIDESLKAGVTVTGAFDDSSACYMGGVAVTDNLERRVLSRGTIDKSLSVLVHVPEKKVVKSSVRDLDFSPFKHEFEEAFKHALAGDYYRAITMNSKACAAAFGLSDEVAELARSKGAVAAGISGTGPSTVALVRERDRERVKAVLEKRTDGHVLEARVNDVPAKEVVPRLL